MNSSTVGLRRPILELKNITKIFGGLVAISDVSFSIARNSIVGLIGPNGAGKTTVFNCITGNYVPESGDIFLEQTSIKAKKPYSIVKMGISRTFQSIRLFQGLPVIENVLAGCHCHLKSGFLASMFHPASQKNEERVALEKSMYELDFMGLADKQAELAGTLSYGNQRLLEIARALANDPQLIILDEPAGGMNVQETQTLIAKIGEIRKRGITVLLIEHDMRLVMQVCDKLVVLEYGLKIADDIPAAVRQNPMVIEAYLGMEDN